MQIEIDAVQKFLGLSTWPLCSAVRLVAGSRCFCRLDQFADAPIADAAQIGIQDGNFLPVKQRDLSRDHAGHGNPLDAGNVFAFLVSMRELLVEIPLQDVIALAVVRTFGPNGVNWQFADFQHP